MFNIRNWVFAGFLSGCTVSALAAELRVPAQTAYGDPDFDAFRISSRPGSATAAWTNPTQRVLWFGEFRTNGNLDAAVALRLPTDRTTRLRLTVAGISRNSEVTGSGTDLVTADFGRFPIEAPGYQRFTLESLNSPGAPAGSLDALVLSGDIVTNAHFNLKPRRNAASVHLGYPVPKGTNVAAFYCEMTGVDEPVYTYYMACGWHRGYFGMQVNSRSQRRIIFSVWDSGDEAVDRNRVGSADRVTLVGKSEGVVSGDFGNEGTGGHSHLVYPWKTGERQRFVVTAQPVDTNHTVFAGYWFHPVEQRWMLISAWRAPKDGGWLRGLYSFSENFGGSNGHLRRKALFGNQWIRTDRGVWHEVTSARFTHDPTGKSDRLDRFMGQEDGQFFLAHGGFSEGFSKFGDTQVRAATGRSPAGLELPAITMPAKK